MDEISKSQDVRHEAVAKINVQIQGNEKQPTNLGVRVDTEDHGNSLPLRSSSKMCPDMMVSDGKPTAGMTRVSNAS